MDERPAAAGEGEDRLRILDLLVTPLRRWPLVLAVALAVAFAAALVVVVLPSTYTAEIVLLPGEEEQSLAQLAGLTGELPIALLAPGGGRQREVVEALLASRSVADTVITRFDLLDPEEAAAWTAARRRLEDSTRIHSRLDGTIVVEYTSEDPDEAAEVANGYADALNRTNWRVSAEIATQKVDFLEDQLARARGELEAAEDDLMAFGVGERAPEVPEQARATIEAAAELQAQVIAKELEVAQLQRFATASHPDLRAARSELAALRGQLAGITRGSGDASEVFLSFGEVPELGLDYARLLREARKNEEIYLALTAALAQSRIEAADDVPIVSVVDPAIPPERPSGPRGLIIVGVALVIGTAAGLFLAYYLTWLGEARRDPRNREFFAAWEDLKARLRGWLPGSAPPSR